MSGSTHHATRATRHPPHTSGNSHRLREHHDVSTRIPHYHFVHAVKRPPTRDHLLHTVERALHRVDVAHFDEQSHSRQSVRTTRQCWNVLFDAGSGLIHDLDAVLCQDHESERPSIR